MLFSEITCKYDEDVSPKVFKPADNGLVLDPENESKSSQVNDASGDLEITVTKFTKGTY